MKLVVEPLTPARWADLVELFGRPGASVARGCWCMFYRQSGPLELPGKLSLRETRKRALKALVDRGVVPGLLAYRAGRVIGWVSLGPREDYLRLARSPVMKPVDDKATWSIICFFVDAKERHAGVAEALLAAALAWARKAGVKLIEAYPVDRKTRTADDNLWFGTKTMFDEKGFVEVARRKPTRPVMRKLLRPRRRTPAAAATRIDD